MGANVFEDKVPALTERVDPPVIRGAASLAAGLANGLATQHILAGLSGPFDHDTALVAASFDTAIMAFLTARRDLGLDLQRDVLQRNRLFRVARGSTAPDNGRTLRVLAFAAPGDLQMNMPIEFITAHLNVRLDLLFVVSGEELPQHLPDHDVAICVVSDSHPALLKRLAGLLARWPRPVINQPARIAGGQISDLTRDGMARLFAGCPGVHAPVTVEHDRQDLAALLASGAPINEILPGGAWPLLVRPVGSHAGTLLELLHDAGELSVYLDCVSAGRLYLTQFVDYRHPDGLHRKSRVALIAGHPYPCHMAVSDHWMIHYVNAGMFTSSAKRADEAKAMDKFKCGFGARHATAFAAIHSRLGMDYVVLDCADGPDGRLLLFEVEMAAIIHMLDPPELFAYKIPHMRRVFTAFGVLLENLAQGAFV